jgi:hypothetical protein
MTTKSTVWLSGKKIVLVTLFLGIGFNTYADEKLDVLEAQSQEFFKAVTGLEQNYIQEQMNNIQNKGATDATNTANQPVYVQQPQNGTNTEVLTREEHSKNTFNHENEVARIKTDFTRTTKLKDLKIRSMYTFNGKDYAVLYLDDTTTSSSSSATKAGDEMTLSIDGRYKEGDYVLSHKIVSINTRTKMIELSKSIDDEYWYSIYLNNSGVYVSDLKKKSKPKEEKKESKPVAKEEPKPKNVTKEEIVIDKSEIIKDAFKDVEIKSEVSANNDNCRYSVNVSGGINVRNQNNPKATILRILRNKDEFTAKQTVGDWIEIDTIYKNKSGDVMVVKDENNWVNMYNNNITSSCTN